MKLSPQANAKSGWSAAREEKVVAGPAGESALRLIAHRGGFVDETHRENSAPALEAAIRQGYWMVEIDVRQSADGALIAQHDADFKRLFADGRRVWETPWRDVRRLQSQSDGDRPYLFDELASLARDRIRVMIDIKIARPSQEFHRLLAGVLRQNNLLEGAYVIGEPRACRPYLGKALVGIRGFALHERAEQGGRVSGLFFVFENGRTLRPESVRLGHDLGLTVVASVNVDHYSDREARRLLPQSDIQRLHQLGVRHFQIDACYRGWL